MTDCNYSLSLKPRLLRFSLFFFFSFPCCLRLIVNVVIFFFSLIVYFFCNAASNCVRLLLYSHWAVSNLLLKEVTSKKKPVCQYPETAGWTVTTRLKDYKILSIIIDVFFSLIAR